MANEIHIAPLKRPNHVAFIMDGNGRWAKQRGKNRTFGHREGAKSLRRVIEHAIRQEIPVLTFFAFSSENWGRPQAEVNLLMELFKGVLKKEVPELHKQGVCLKIIGDTSRFSKRLQESIDKAERLTQNNRKLTLNIAANYGGRWDITQACKMIAEKVKKGELSLEEINESLVGSQLTLADLSPPDLLIRTGGDQRVSNFLLWQLAYSELYFTQTLWPDFDETSFAEALKCFSMRERRFGLTNN